MATLKLEKEEVDIDDVKVGDHIYVYTWSGGFRIEHHGIVVPGKRVVKVINFTSHGQDKGIIQEQDLGSFSAGAKVYKVRYQASVALEPDTVVYRAKRLLKHPEENNKYHYFNNNCEHFATFCKAGIKQSDQATPSGMFRAAAYTLTAQS